MRQKSDNLLSKFHSMKVEDSSHTGWPKKVSHHLFKKIVLKIANEIRFLRKVKV